MFVLVVTGGLGAGKSTAAEYFRTRGATIIDLDDVAKRALVRGAPVLRTLADEFGEDVLLADGSLDRSALARAAFASPDGAQRLNEIVHPVVAREVGPALQEIRLLPSQPEVVVLEVPLLAEAPLYRELADLVLAIVAPQHVRIARAVERGMSEADAKRRIACQATDAERAELADVVIINDGDETGFLGRLEGFWDEYVMAGERSAGDPAS